MLKGKSKAFKPKGAIRRPTAPARDPAKDPAPREEAPSLKRKERDEEDPAEPPPKRIPTPTPTSIHNEEEGDSALDLVSVASIAQQLIITPAPTPTESPPVLLEPTPPTTDATAPRKQLPSVSPVTLTSNPTPPVQQRAAPSELPSAADEAPLPSTSAIPNSTEDAILSAPSQSAPSPYSTTAVRTTLPSSASPSTPLVRSAQRAGLASTGGPAASATSSQSNTRAGLGPAGGSVISNNRNKNGGPSNPPTLGPAGDVGEESNVGPSRVSQVVQMVALNPDGTPGGIIEGPAPTKKVVRRKQAKLGPDDARATIEMQLARPRLKKGTGSKKKKKRKDRPSTKREDTPESAEDEVIDPATLTMSDLCKDLRIGKKLSKHNDIKERLQKQKDIVKAARLARNNPEVADGELLIAGEGQPDGNLDGAESQPAAGDGPSRTSVAGTGPEQPEAAVEEEIDKGPQGRSVTMRIVDGQIVVDERSMQIDRHRDGQTGEEMEVIEENDFTKITTSGTYMKREKNQSWDWAAMETFYRGLRTFGTDFGMIANMFPHRTRKQIKLRFNKEERENPERINKILSAPPLSIDFEEYEEMSQGKYLEVEEIEAEQKALEEEHNAIQAKHEADHAATIKKKKDAIHARINPAAAYLAELSDDEDFRTGDVSSAKENRAPSSAGAGGSRSREQSAAAAAPMKGKKKRNAGKSAKGNKHSMRAGGEEVEILGFAD